MGGIYKGEFVYWSAAWDSGKGSLVYRLHGDFVGCEPIEKAGLLDSV